MFQSGFMYSASLAGSLKLGTCAHTAPIFFLFAPPLIYNSLILHIKSLTIQPSKELRSNLEWCMNLLCNSVYIQNTDVTSSLQTDSGYVGGWVWCGSESGATSQSADDSLLLQ